MEFFVDVLRNRTCLPSASSHLWKEKLVLVWAHTWRKQKDCLCPSLEQSVGKKLLFHWFGFCHLEPLLLMTSERDSWYVCFLGQLLYWLRSHPKTVGFTLLLSQLHHSWLHHLLQQHQLICSEVLNHPKTDQIFAKLDIGIVSFTTCCTRLHIFTGLMLSCY